jgi:hypothetical protein
MSQDSPGAGAAEPVGGIAVCPPCVTTTLPAVAADAALIYSMTVTTSAVRRYKMRGLIMVIPDLSALNREDERANGAQPGDLNCDEYKIPYRRTYLASAEQILTQSLLRETYSVGRSGCKGKKGRTEEVI